MTGLVDLRSIPYAWERLRHGRYGVTVGGNPGSGKPPDGAGPKGKPADGNAGGGEAKDHGGVFSPDARWVVLLSALSAAVTVLAYAGVQGSTLVHIFTPSAASHPPHSARSSPSPRPDATQPTQPIPASLLPALTSASPSPTQESSSPAAVPSDFDNVATDPTVISVATMLPQHFSDSSTVFNRVSASTELCPPASTSATASVNNTLQNYGCAGQGEVVGNYLDSTQQIQVVVWVIPFPDKADAGGAYNILEPGAAAPDWGIWCPPTGTGSQDCQGQAWQDATQYAWTFACHRYLMRTLALYVDLAPDSNLGAALNSAAKAAVTAVGPETNPIAYCQMVTAGS